MNEKIKLVTQVTLENGTVYYLYSDGNLYTQENGKLAKVQNLTDGNKKIIEKIMSLYKPAKTDVIDKDITGKTKKTEEKVDVEIPEM